jgi:hypothetical protein
MDLESFRNKFKPGVKVMFYLDFDDLTDMEKNQVRELISKTGANFRFDKEYSLGAFSVSIPFMSKEQFEIMKRKV